MFSTVSNVLSHGRLSPSVCLLLTGMHASFPFSSSLPTSILLRELIGKEKKLLVKGISPIVHFSNPSFCITFKTNSGCACEQTFPITSANFTNENSFKILFSRPPLLFGTNQINIHKRPPSFYSSSGIPLAALNDSDEFASETVSENANNFESKRDIGLIMGIETSCDETGVAIVTTDGLVLGEALASQMAIHSEYGGVFPKIAKMEHEKNIDRVIHDALCMAKVSFSDLSAVAVTQGPGLSLCLSVGIRKARKISHKYQLPLINVHHMEAHALVIRMTEKDINFPFLVLLISGGHNLALLAHGVGHYTQLSTTLDDALGEAYDKTARILGLPLMEGGGRALEILAQEGDEYAFPLKVPMKSNPSTNFSYAGLKTAVRCLVETHAFDAEKKPLEFANMEERKRRADIAASFQRTAILHLEDKLSKAIDHAKQLNPNIHSLVIAGGVASNSYVRSRLQYCFGNVKMEEIEEGKNEEKVKVEKEKEKEKKERSGDSSTRKKMKNVKKYSLKLYFPAPHLCTDNGTMVAWAGVENFRLGRFEPPVAMAESDEERVDIKARWPLGIPIVSKENDDGMKSAKKRQMFPSLSSLTILPKSGN